jgi:2,4-dienoyl-CoA reductase-like NADH-dependent reductase (Old Yellow Enzyme family)
MTSGVHRATKHDILETYRPYIKNAKVILNSGIQPEEGEELLASGKVDAICIGFNWITHPDLAKCVEHGKPLTTSPISHTCRPRRATTTGAKVTPITQLLYIKYSGNVYGFCWMLYWLSYSGVVEYK